MATIALAAAVASAESTILTAAATTVGALIDNYALFPALFPQEAAVGGRLGNLNLHETEEGAPTERMYGPTVRVSGTVIWLSPVITDNVSQSHGKGGSVTSREHFVSVAVATGRGPISTVLKIFADGKTIFDLDSDVTFTSNQLSVDKIGGTNEAWIKSTPSGPNLKQFISGENVTCTNFANGGNNGSHRILEKAQNATTGATKLRVRNNSAVNEAAGNNVTLDQDQPVWKSGVRESSNFYVGSASQTADPIIESFEGVGNVPGHRGIAYVVIEKLRLTDFGNRLPNFEFLVEAQASKTVGSAIGDELQLAGMSTPDFDVSAITTALSGYSIRGPQEVARVLQPLLVAYNVAVQLDGAKLKFVGRNNVPTVSIAVGALAADEEGNDSPRPVSVLDQDESRIPGEVHVTHVDPGLRYATGTQHSNVAKSDFRPTLTVSIPLVVTADSARQLAKRILWEHQTNRHKHRVQLPPSRRTVLESDKLEYTALGDVRRVLVTSVERGRSGLVVVEGVDDVTAGVTFEEPA